MQNIIRLGQYEVDREDARNLVQSADIGSPEEVTLNCRHTTFMGTSYADELFQYLWFRGTETVYVLGGHDRTFQRLHEYGQRYNIAVYRLPRR